MDRDETLRRAEKLLRQGRLDAAIAEYARLVEDQPKDWTTANLLGDLYVRAGQIDQAVAQYARIADHLAREGFVSKASALYKKIVKIHPDDDAALRRTAELSSQQGLTGDARMHWQALFQHRMRRGDAPGAAAAAAAYAAVDPADASGRFESARMFADLGDPVRAAAELRAAGETFMGAGKAADAVRCWQSAITYHPADVAARDLLVNALIASGEIDASRVAARSGEHWRAVAAGLTRAGRHSEAPEALEQALAADPDDRVTRVQLARASIANHDLVRARAVLAPVAAAGDPLVQFALAEIAFRSGDFTAGREALRGCLADREDLAAPAVELGCAIGPDSPEAGFALVEAVVAHAEAGGDTDLALDVLERFLAVVPRHAAALEALIEVCGQTFYEHQRYRAQVRLADVYLATGEFERARRLAEELTEARPDDPGHVQRLGRALSGLGVADGEQAARARVQRIAVSEGTDDFVAASGPASPIAEDVTDADVSTASSAWADPVGVPVEPAVTPPQDVEAAPEPRWETAESVEAPQREAFEIDLSGDLDELLSPVQRPEGPPAQVPDVQEHPGGLEGFFEELREERGRDLEEAGAALSYDQASEHFNRGDIEAAAECLRAAARDPHYRFRAASMLARIARDQDHLGEAVEWLERAGEAPAPTAEASLGLLYELGDLLEAAREDARALAVFIELEAASPGYRDVAERIAGLSEREAGPIGPEKGHP